MQYTVNRSPYAGANRILTTNALKIIAAIAMVLDHIAYFLIPESQIYLHIVFRILGRLAFPLFAYCIAEGCRYTRNKTKRFLSVFLFGLGIELIVTLYNLIAGGGLDRMAAAGDFATRLDAFRSCLDGNIFLTFSCSILLIYIVQMFKQAWAEHRWARMGLAAILFVAAGVGVYLFNRLMMGISYGIFGAILPLTVSVTDYEEGKAPAFFKRLDHPLLKMGLFAIGLVVIAASSSMKVVQSFGLLALIPLSMYNGKGGSKKLKWWFYAFYPAHLVVIWLIGFLINGI